MVTEQNIQKFSVQCKAIFEQLGRDVIGMREVVEGAVVAMIAGGNVLLEGVPGVVWCVRWGGCSAFPFRESSSRPT